ncbi:integrase [Salmonella enterica]|nr:integrase [Salmonella enterica]
MCAALKRCAYRHKGKIMENTNIVTTEQQAPNTISASNAIFNVQALGQLTAFANLMADSQVTVPAHLAGKPADCMAIVMQAMQWGMNPYAVAQKTHLVNGYAKENPFSGINRLKKAKGEPDPLTTDEFIRFIQACGHQQMRNLWSLAVYTGMRHGELCGLAWEDIDLHAGTIIVKRNLTQTDEFTLPKTDAGTDRVIYLIQPAIDALRNQAQLTRLGRQFEVEVKLREYGQSVIQPCTFVFSPQCVKRGPRTGYHYAVNSINKIWAPIIKRAGIRYRNAYQSRHTYACWSLSAGANPNFIATQMGHTDAQMVYKVYGKWMSEKSAEQVSLLNQALSRYAPSLPQSMVAAQ